MESKKTIKPLIILSVIAILFNLARLEIWGTTNILYITWILLLAWIPYLIYVYLIRKDVSINYFIPIFIVWLLFFPNAPYLVTDISHIVLSSPTLLWYDSLLYFFFGWIGLFLGVLSLFKVHQYLRGHLNYMLSEIFVFIICAISSFGVYIGRFERFNSWDILFHPLQLMRHFFYVLINFTHGGTPLLFVFVFTVFMYSVYKTVYVFSEQNKNV